MTDDLDDDTIRRLETELALLHAERLVAQLAESQPVALQELLRHPPLAHPEPLRDFSGVVVIGDDSALSASTLPIDIRPHLLAEDVVTDLTDCDSLVVSSPKSFPFKELWRTFPELPIDVCLDRMNLEDAVELAQTQGLTTNLTFLDRLVVDDDRLWRELRAKAGWAHGQRLRDRREVLTEPVETAAFERRGPTDPIEYWKRRAQGLAVTSPHHAVGSVRHGRRVNKLLFLQQARALRSHLLQHPETRILELGCGVGRVTSLFSRAVHYTGADVAAAAVRQASRNFPEHDFEVISGERLPWPDEQFDQSLTVAVLHHNTKERRVAMLHELARVTRPGGKLLFLEDVVGAAGPGDNVFSMSIRDLLEELSSAPAQVVVEHLEAVGYAHVRGSRSVLLRLARTV